MNQAGNKWAAHTAWDAVGQQSPQEGANRLIEAGKAAEETQQAAVEAKINEALEDARIGLDKIPAPVAPEGDGVLTDAERKRFEKCNAAVDLASEMWFIQGKALDTIATGRLFRDIPHKTDPTRCYATIEEWVTVEKDLSVPNVTRLRAGWDIGERLHERGFTAVAGQVRTLVPVKNKYGLNAAIAVFLLAVDVVGADKLTAARLEDLIRALPADLELDDPDEDADALAKTIKGVLVNREGGAAVSRAIPAAVTRAVDKRAITIADALNRPRIPRSEVTLRLMEAFVDPDDTTVYEAVLARMKKQARAGRKELG
ncbi:hypothetical protein HHL19_35870 [Streptomyces sp. R302]|uniref:hypothetical protein n=1 Tax=unclassified Streptomyces TaxID=2593676 RepID=UPI00145DCCAD|nr:MULTISPECIES: hypothetical protein [unclassified Streptomyces]NML55081.1 hypothetical protein [Streptomyces sp. R301]NML83889.1 hypothetical protein [Streptomyces sp. R302]